MLSELLLKWNMFQNAFTLPQSLGPLYQEKSHTYSLLSMLLVIETFVSGHMFWSSAYGPWARLCLPPSQTPWAWLSHSTHDI